MPPKRILFGRKTSDVIGNNTAIITLPTEPPTSFLNQVMPGQGVTKPDFSAQLPKAPLKFKTFNPIILPPFPVLPATVSALRVVPMHGALEYMTTASSLGIFRSFRSKGKVLFQTLDIKTSTSGQWTFRFKSSLPLEQLRRLFQKVASGDEVELVTNLKLSIPTSDDDDEHSVEY